METLSKNLRALRKQKGLTQQQAANQVYVSRAALTHYETGRHTPHLDILQRLSELYGVPIDHMVKKVA